jgi:hypothetical protein
MPAILQELKDYIKTRFELLKLETIDDASAIIADLFADLAILFCLVLAFIFFTLALAFFLGSLFKSLWLGYGAVTLIYMALIFLSHLLKGFFQNKLISLLVNKILKNKQ